MELKLFVLMLDFYISRAMLVNRCCKCFTGQEQLNHLLAKTSSEEVKLRHCEQYRQKLCTDLTDRASRIQRRMEQYNNVVTERTRLRRQHISDLIMYIFPISELPARR